jgi:hypothetical protein
MIDLEAYPGSGNYVVSLQVQIVTEADLDALDRILRTLVIRL